MEQVVEILPAHLSTSHMPPIPDIGTVPRVCLVMRLIDGDLSPVSMGVGAQEKEKENKLGVNFTTIPCLVRSNSNRRTTMPPDG